MPDSVMSPSRAPAVSDSCEAVDSSSSAPTPEPGSTSMPKNVPLAVGPPPKNSPRMPTQRVSGVPLPVVSAG